MQRRTQATLLKLAMEVVMAATAPLLLRLILARGQAMAGTADILRTLPRLAGMAGTLATRRQPLTPTAQDSMAAIPSLAPQAAVANGSSCRTSRAAPTSTTPLLVSAR